MTELIRPKIRKLLQRRSFGPTLVRDRRHAPEPGLGGEIYWVSYRGEHIGAIRSVWDHRGIHWEADVPGGTVAEDDVDLPRAFDTHVDAINMLFRAHGLKGDYEGSLETWNVRS